MSRQFSLGGNLSRGTFPVEHLNGRFDPVMVDQVEIAPVIHAMVKRSLDPVLFNRAVFTRTSFKRTIQTQVMCKCK